MVTDEEKGGTREEVSGAALVAEEDRAMYGSVEETNSEDSFNQPAPVCKKVERTPHAGVHKACFGDAGGKNEQKQKGSIGGIRGSKPYKLYNREHRRVEVRKN